jgi:[acyl-carrier-protein] S-malonyltransferase
VRWDLCLATMAEIGITGLLELPPAGTLTGIAKRNLKGVELFSLNTPDQLPDAQDFVARHGDAGWANPLASTPSWRMLVSPIKGEFTKAAGIETGQVVSAGTVIGTAANLRDSVEVRTTHDGTVTEWLVEDGDPVAPGQPLIRLYPATEAGAAQ